MSFRGDIYLHKAPGRDVTVFRESLVWKQPVKATRPVSDYVAIPTIYNNKLKKKKKKRDGYKLHLIKSVKSA